MNKSEQNNENRDRMELYFDNMMSEEDRQQFLADMEGNETFLAACALQSRIDQALGNAFQFDTKLPTLPENEQPTTNLAKSRNNVPTDSVRRPQKSDGQSRWTSSVIDRRVIGFVIAATLVGVLATFVWRFFPDRSPVFQSQQLAAIYEDSVERGFYPYYECHDMRRFADTFEHRQGIPLTLAPMPDDRKMLGISYMGGVSRDATAMLCEVKGEPVLVFVDKEENHDPDLMKTETNSPVAVFSKIRDGLVFYEVNRFGEVTMMDYLVPVSSD